MFADGRDWVKDERPWTLSEGAGLSSIWDGWLRATLLLTEACVKAKREFTVVIERDEDGFYVGTVPELRGSHSRLKHADGRVTSVPSHAGETIGPGLLRSILRDIEMSTDDLLKLLSQ